MREFLRRAARWLGLLDAAPRDPGLGVLVSGRDWPADRLGITRAQVHEGLSGITPGTAEAAGRSLRAQGGGGDG